MFTNGAGSSRAVLLFAGVFFEGEKQRRFCVAQRLVKVNEP
jgi:hypothetical protein